MKAILLSLIVFTSVAAAESADEAAKRIIKAEGQFAYNPIDGSEEEKLKSTIINSKMRLNWLMIYSEDVSEELRICYALQLLEKSLAIREKIRSGTELLPAEEKLIETQKLLAERLYQIQAEQVSTGQPM